MNTIQMVDLTTQYQQVKLTYLDSYIQSRRKLASLYDTGLTSLGERLETPYCLPESGHVYNQYTFFTVAYRG